MFVDKGIGQHNVAVAFEFVQKTGIDPDVGNARERESDDNDSDNHGHVFMRDDLFCQAISQSILIRS